jgi:dTDP-4-dehydrorhamnose 3,5-epimerase
MITVEKTRLEGVLLIKPQQFEDFRGFYLETYNKELYVEHGITVDFVQDDISVSRKHVLRGIHGDQKTWKLVSCLYGSFYLTIVNCDESSANFGMWQAFTLSDTNRFQVLVPPKHGNAHVVLTDNAMFHYKQSEYYVSENKFFYRYDDPRFNIWWPVKQPILSQRDELAKYIPR